MFHRKRLRETPFLQIIKKISPFPIILGIIGSVLGYTRARFDQSIEIMKKLIHLKNSMLGDQAWIELFIFFKFFIIFFLDFF